jgi:hypothetical protein
MGPRRSSISNLKLSGKFGKGGVKLGKLHPILEPLKESDDEGDLRGMQRQSKSVPDLHSSRGISREGREERLGVKERRSDPFHDFLNGSPIKRPSNSKVGESDDDSDKTKKVTKSTIAEELRRLRQDDRDFKEGFRNLQAKSKHEGSLSGGVSLLQGDVDSKLLLSRNCRTNVELPSLPSAHQELQKLQELIKKQQRDLGFLAKEEESEDEKEFKSAFRSLLK